eukprot:m.40940 g.40940  ORF g.40940 m.40940 type:complete len:94 (+) comp11765_c1_seq1:2115-2396(+)
MLFLSVHTTQEYIDAERRYLLFQLLILRVFLWLEFLYHFYFDVHNSTLIIKKVHEENHRNKSISDGDTNYIIVFFLSTLLKQQRQQQFVHKKK